MRHLPECKQDAKAQNDQRDDDKTDDFAELPSDLPHPPLAAFVESYYARHHYLHWMVGGWGATPLGAWVAASSAQWWDRSVSESACGDTSQSRRPKAATGKI